MPGSECRCIMMVGAKDAHSCGRQRAGNDQYDELGIVSTWTSKHYVVILAHIHNSVRRPIRKLNVVYELQYHLTEDWLTQNIFFHYCELRFRVLFRYYLCCRNSCTSTYRTQVCGNLAVRVLREYYNHITKKAASLYSPGKPDRPSKWRRFRIRKFLDDFRPEIDVEIP